MLHKKLPLPWSEEKLFTMKPVPGARKLGIAGLSNKSSLLIFQKNNDDFSLKISVVVPKMWATDSLGAVELLKGIHLYIEHAKQNEKRSQRSSINTAWGEIRQKYWLV